MDLCIVVRRWSDAPHERFAPGKIVYLQDLIEENLVLERFFDVPLPVLCMCMRDRETLRMIDLDMLKRLDSNFSSVQVLFSKWSTHLQPEICTLLGLDADRLINDGLTKRHVRRLNWPLSTWVDLFGLENRHVKELGIRNQGAYFDNLDAELADACVSAEALDINR